ncbi:hypothetical protein SAMN05519104_1899 [Rhizobiales bacterium GAS188]|nr:hypothetical protein SAMN05519104_1899 [Rhizobiales bacterium GAS188]
MGIRVLLAGACLVCACLACALAGCAVVDPVDSRYDAIARSLAKGRNETILLNLVRASHDYPLSFVTIANVTPSLSNTTSFGLPSFLLGPAPRGVGPLFTPGRDVVFGNQTVSNTTAVSTNFNVSTQETSAFYTGFLKPIDLQTLDYFIRQGYSRELLFWLFTQSVEFDLPGRAFLYSYNPPDDYGCPREDPKQRCFREFVLMAIYAGLTVEERTVQKAASGPRGGSASGQGGGKTETTSFFRFCFDRQLAAIGQNAMGSKAIEVKTKFLDLPITSVSPKCGSYWDPRANAGLPQTDTLDFNAGSIKFRVRPRSAFGIFQFLGTLIKMQRDHPDAWQGAYYPRPEVLDPPTLATVHDDRYVFKISFNEREGCFAHTWFNDGDYCVPEDATNSKRIFNLLAQLIAIETAATDLSITPTVRVIQ